MSGGIPIYQLSKVICGIDRNDKKPCEYLPFIFEIYSDGHLLLANAPKKVNLTVSLQKIMVQVKQNDDNIQIDLSCQAINGQRLTIHIITDEKHEYEIFSAMKEVSADHNLDQFLLNHQQQHYRDEHLPSHGPPPVPVVFNNSNPNSQHQYDEVKLTGSSSDHQNVNQEGTEHGMVAGDIVVYQNDRLYFSALRERNLRFTIVWKPWAARTVVLYSNGILTYNKPKRGGEIPKHKMFNVQNIEVTLMGDEESGDNANTDYGLIVKCHTVDNIETYFRCIVSDSELDSFLNGLKSVALTHNIDTLQRNQLTVKKKSKRYLFMRNKQSVMRRAVTKAMDKFDMRSKRDRIVSKRGTMKWLPVVGANDLIHGSWWFVWGSVGSVITAIVILQNKTHPIWNEDDSTLSTEAFIATWVLICMSGIFSTVGSLFFVRAFHENPPMSPMFPNIYHLQCDELVASWLFFLATLPSIPYCFIYLASAGFRNLSYLVALILSIIAVLGTLLFARACYPTDEEKVTNRFILFFLLFF
jgi:hypothetical protein